MSRQTVDLIEPTWDRALRDLAPEVGAVVGAGGECPVQVEGFLQTGESIYFRARHEWCELWVGAPGSTPPCWEDDPAFVWHGEKEGFDDAGRLSPVEASTELRDLIRRFRADSSA